jgi:hypothetical protein
MSSILGPELCRYRYEKSLVVMASNPSKIGTSYYGTLHLRALELLLKNT